MTGVRGTRAGTRRTRTRRTRTRRTRRGRRGTRARTREEERHLQMWLCGLLGSNQSDLSDDTGQEGRALRRRKARSHQVDDIKYS